MKHIHLKSRNSYAFIAFEVKPNSFSPVDTKNIELFNNTSITDLAQLDNTTKLYTEEVIRTSIQNANVVDSNDLNGELVILYNKKKLPIITNEIIKNFDIYTFIDATTSKKIINQVYSKAKTFGKKNKKFVAELEKFNEIFKNLDKDKSLYNLLNVDINSNLNFYKNRYNYFFQYFFSFLEYEEQRDLYFYVYNNIFLNKEDKSNIIRIREKNNEEAA